MALQDLTPQLRTRLSRMERTVGWFVLFATALLLLGFGYYLYNTAASKGWFLKKIPYQTCVSSGAGLKIGDPVKLMGFNVGEITDVVPNDPYDYYNITVLFQVLVNEKHYEGYIWSDSKVKVNAGDLLGGRYLEITKGAEGVPTVPKESGAGKELLILKHKFIEAKQKELLKQGKSLSDVLALLNDEVKKNPALYYTNHIHANAYFLDPLESPAVTERLDKLVTQIENALPNFLGLTNQLTQILNNGVDVTSNLNVVAVNAKPASENLAALSAQLRGPGALGEWALPPGGPAQLAAALTNANTLLSNTDTNLSLLVGELSRSLDNLANITSNLNSQVQANTNIVKEVSDAIVHTDDLIQGLKRHWLLRSAFKTPKTNEPPAKVEGTSRAPNDPFRR